MLKTEMEIVLANSEIPLLAAFPIARKSIFVFPRYKIPSRFTKKYITGKNPPTPCAIAVAIAAPARPQSNTIMNKASSPTFNSPAITAITKPSFGFSAAMKNIWKSCCSDHAGSAIITILA